MPDFEAASDTVTITNGTKAKLAVAINEDALDEADETFTVVISSVTGANVVDGTAVGTITDDDTVLSISPTPST